MDKKEVLINILDKLSPYRDMAIWLKAMIELWHMDDSFTDNLITIINGSIKNTTSLVTKTKLQKASQILQDIRTQSEKQQQIDIQNADQLLESL